MLLNRGFTVPNHVLKPLTLAEGRKEVTVPIIDVFFYKFEHVERFHNKLENLHTNPNKEHESLRLQLLKSR